MSKIVKKEYDCRGNEIYREYIDGYWEKREYDSRGNETYFENSNGDWVKWECDANGNCTYYENSTGYWWKAEYDKNGNKTYLEDSDGYWCKREYDDHGDETYCETSDGDKNGTPKAEPKIPDLVDRNKVLEIIFNIMSDDKIVHKHRALNRNIKQLPKVELKHELIDGKPYVIFGIYRRDE